MEEEVRKERTEEEFQTKQEELRRKDEEKTEKNRKRREKIKARKQKGDAGEDGADADKNNGKRTNGMDLAAGRLPMSEPRGERDVEHVNRNGEVKASEEVGIVICDED